MLRRYGSLFITSLVILSVLLGACGPQERTLSPSSAAPASGNTGTIRTGKVIASSTATALPAGGIISVNKPGDPLNGMKLIIPAGAFADSQQFTISYSNVESHTFGEAFNPITPLITIDNGGRFADGLLQLDIPVSVPPGFFAMGFFYDEKNNTLEGLPTISRDGDSITVATRHFSRILISSIDETKLKNDIDSKFKPGANDWQIPNNGAYITPGGNCAGMSLSAMWYYVTKPDGKTATLNGRYDNNGMAPASPSFWWDDSLAYRFVSVVQQEYEANWKSYLEKLDDEIITGYAPSTDAETLKMFRYSIQVTGEPQFVAIYSKTGSGHAMIVYRVAGGSLYVADPNYAGKTDRRIVYAGDKFSPYNSGANQEEIDKGKTINYETINYGAKTALIDWKMIARDWQDFKQKTIGDYEFPQYKVKYKGADGKLKELADGTVVSTSKIHITAESEGLTLEVIVCRDGYAAVLDSNGDVELKPGANLLGILIMGKVGSDEEYIDYKSLTITYNPAATTSTTTKGPAVYKLQVDPFITQVTKPSAAGVMASIFENTATYISPDPQVGSITQTVNWVPPEEIAPGGEYKLTFKSIISVAKANKYTLNMPGGAIETYPQTLTNPWFRIVTAFAYGGTNLGPAGAFQYSPDGGATWRTPFTADEAWSKYYETGMKQVLLPINIWPPFVSGYLPPNPARPLPLQTPPQESVLLFRLRPDLGSPLPDKLMITVIAQATGLPPSGGDSVAAVQFTYVKQ